MKHTVVASVDFYYQGQRYTPAVTIDLETLVASQDGLLAIYPMVAQKNGIDLYSYVYEIMLQHEIKFHQAQGLLKDYVLEGFLDFEAIDAAWQAKKVSNILRAISQKYMGIESLENHPELHQALLEAFRLGKES